MIFPVHLKLGLQFLVNLVAQSLFFSSACLLLIMDNMYLPIANPVQVVFKKFHDFYAGTFFNPSELGWDNTN